MCEAYTAEEATEHFIEELEGAVLYCTQLENKTLAERMDLLVFSILVTLDGCSEYPLVDMTLRPHPDDKEFHRKEGDNWYEPGTIINRPELHHIWANRLKPFKRRKP